MSAESESDSDLQQLQQRVEIAKILIHRSGIKVEELSAAMRSIFDLKDRLVIFPRNIKRHSADEVSLSPAVEPGLLKAA